MCLRLQVCEEGGCSKEEIEGEVRAILAEMGHSMFLPSVRFLALLLRPFVRSALRGIFVNREGLEQVSSRRGRKKQSMVYFERVRLCAPRIE